MSEPKIYFKAIHQKCMLWFWYQLNIQITYECTTDEEFAIWGSKKFMGAWTSRGMFKSLDMHGTFVGQVL